MGNPINYSRSNFHKSHYSEQGLDYLEGYQGAILMFKLIIISSPLNQKGQGFYNPAPF